MAVADPDAAAFRPAHPPGRLGRVDALRGLAMVWMTVYHFVFDLNHFHLVRPQDFYFDPFWTWQRTGIVGLFLLTAGMGQALAVQGGQSWPRFGRRLLQVAGCALLVTLGSLWMFPQSWISFGVLHGMAAMLLITRWAVLRGLGGVWPWLLGALLIAAAPHMVRFSGTLYPDALFAVAGLGVAFELWRCMRERRVSGCAAFMLAISLPFALFARSNGLVWWLPLAYAIWRLRGRERVKLLLLGSAWSVAAFGAATTQAGAPQGAMFPLVLFETVNFLQPHPFDEALGERTRRVSELTAQTLARYATEQELARAYDRNYWDSLSHTPDSPHLGRITQADRDILVKEFWRHNVWRNAPAFLSSRVNVFLVAALAQGHFPTKIQHSFALQQIGQPDTPPRAIPGLTDAVRRLDAFSWRWRWLLWTPLPGIALLFSTLLLAWRERGTAELMVLLPMLAQLGGVFLFSSAGEYRYLLPFFVVPLLLFPVRAELQPGRSVSARPF